MANIDQYLEDIEVASRGEEVRDSIIDAFEALNSEGPGTMAWNNITGTPDTLTGYGVSEVPASMVSGVLALNNIPPSALERVVPVADDTARFALTSSDVQNGDTVKVLSTMKLYLVVDDTSLSTEAGYEEYRAGTADSVDWSGVLNTPDSLAGYGIEDAYTKDEVDDITTSEEGESDAGNPIVVETDAAQYAKATHLTLAPVQDLHGYDHPWAGGAGKNLLPMTVAGIKAVNTSGTWNGNVYTLNSLTFTILTDEVGNVIGIKVNGTASGNSTFNLSGAFYLSENNYIITGTPSGGGMETYRITLYHGSNTAIDIGSGASVSITTTNDIAVNIRIGNGTNISNMIFYPMLRLSTETDATFAPYSNICPITGVDEVEVRATGKNLASLNCSWYTSAYGTAETNQYYISSIVKVAQNEQYTISGNGGSGDYNVVGFYYEFPDENSVSYNNGRSVFEANYTFTSPIDGYAVIRSNVPYKDTVQIERGSTATAYEPYTEYTASIDLPEPVYSGTLDLETGELVCDRKTVDFGDLSWGYYNNRFSAELSDAKSIADWNKNKVIFSAYKRYAVFPDETANNGCAGIYSKYIYVRNLAYSSASDFKAAMTGQKVCYELETPITYQLTPQQLALFKGINNVSTNAKTVQVTYRNGELATTGDIVASTEVAKRSILGEAASDTDAKLATSLAPILGNFATAETSPTSASHAVGEYLLYNGNLYKVLAAISAGQQLTIGTNIGQTNVAAELASLNNVAVHFISDANEGSGTQSNLIDVITNAMTVNGFYQIKGTYTNHSYGYTAIGWRVSYSNEPRYAGVIICHDGNVIAFSKQGTSTAVIKVLATP